MTTQTTRTQHSTAPDSTIPNGTKVPRMGMSGQMAAASASTTAATTRSGYAGQHGWLAPRTAGRLPQFLIISPPKTGSTWLACNLRCHPELFIPDCKEVRYFGSFCKWLDLDWYASQFNGGDGKMKGDASPSYSLLPCRTIQQLRELLPDVKLIFLMRDPVSRAWSHARHNWRYREANFRDTPRELQAVSEAQWQANFRDPWPLQSGDYLGQLRRWLSVFPAEQVYVDFYERIEENPVGLLSDIFRFLDVSDAVDWATFRAEEFILQGVSRPLEPSLEDYLRALLLPRTQQLVHFLHDHLSLDVGNLWTRTLGSPPSQPTPEPVFDKEMTEDALDLLIEDIDFNQARMIHQRVYGKDIVFWRGKFLVLPDGGTNASVESWDAAQILARGRIVPGDSLQAAREFILSEQIDELRQQQGQTHVELKAELQTLRSELQDCHATARTAWSTVDALLVAHERLVDELQETQTFVARIRQSALFQFRRDFAAWCKSWKRWLRGSTKDVSDPSNEKKTAITR